MALIARYPKYGNLSVYDIRHLINVHNFKQDFNRLTLVKDFHLHQHSVSAIRSSSKYIKKRPHDSKYPELKTYNPPLLERLCDTFLYFSGARDE